MTDIEIFVDRIGDLRIAQMNLVLETTRQESDFFSHTIHDDLDSIVQDIRQSQVTDRTTANPQPTFTEVKEKFDHAM